MLRIKTQNQKIRNEKSNNFSNSANVHIKMYNYHYNFIKRPIYGRLETIFFFHHFLCKAIWMR